MASTVQLSKAAIQKVADSVRKGVPPSYLAHVIGVTPPVLKKWIANGRVMIAHMETTGAFPPGSTKQDWLCYDLTKSLDAAREKAIARWVTRINSRASRDWKAAAWLLGRLARDEFGDRATVSAETSPAPEGGVRTKVSIYIPDNGRDPA